MEEDKKQQSKEIQDLQQKCEEYLNGWKRAKADYINLKKETDKKQAEIMRFAAANFFMSLLPIIDNVKQAISHIPDAEKEKDWVEGFINIKKQFDELLTNLRIEEIKTTGEKFNPEFHEAVSKEKVEGKEEGIVVKEVSGGYMIEDKVIVPAKVVVSE
ncbi:MAG TPA: nucleotide exchange factor GrpE [Patescibacteria group bacterium]